MAFGVYVHWPFCAAKCPYCDFNSHVVAAIDADRWRHALVGEIRRYASLTRENIVHSVFFGGGTPSLMPVETVQSVIDVITNEWPVANDIEITLEANPTSVDATRFRGYRMAGVNRLSVGVQSLRDADLKALGRLHTVDEAKEAFELARATFPRISMDLIYARQYQTLADWSEELDEALTMAADHLSLYQLTVEDGTAFHARHSAGGLRGLPDEELAADMYELTAAKCADAGFQAYEVSNYARDGAESRHNLIYWRGQPYVGVGPGAHGRIQLDGSWVATAGHKAPSRWLQAAEAGSGDEFYEAVSDSDRSEEQLLMGLRLLEGIPLELAKRAIGDEFEAKISLLETSGALSRKNERLIATPAGRLALNYVITNLLI